jgi:hypothetical protein
MVGKRLIRLSATGLAIGTLASVITMWTLWRAEDPAYLAHRNQIREWSERLRACDSLDAIKQHFSGYTVERQSDGTARQVWFSNTGVKPTALIAIFADGRWVACVYRRGSYSSESPVVTRDSSGRIRAFLSDQVGALWLEGDTLEKIYEELARGDREVPAGR